jgi:hypothetical protein
MMSGCRRGRRRRERRARGQGHRHWLPASGREVMSDHGRAAAIEHDEAELPPELRGFGARANLALRVARSGGDHDAREPGPIRRPCGRGVTIVSEFLELTLVVSVDIDDPGASRARPACPVVPRALRSAPCWYPGQRRDPRGDRTWPAPLGRHPVGTPYCILACRPDHLCSITVAPRQCAGRRWAHRHAAWPRSYGGRRRHVR